MPRCLTHKQHYPVWAYNTKRSSLIKQTKMTRLNSAMLEAVKAEALAKSDLEQVVRAHGVQLIKAGPEFKALCPFHSEKSPSFTVTPSTQLCYCFGCGKGGDAISFIELIRGIGFVDAVIELAESVGVNTSALAAEPDGTRTLVQLMEAATSYYQAQLRKQPDVLKYLTSRGISGDLIDRYRIGYAPPRGMDVTKTVKCPESDWLRAGVIMEGADKTTRFPVMRSRITFPIADHRGRIVGMGGRAFGEVKGSKYLNTPETTIYSKGKLLFGLGQARKAMSGSMLTIVEGYFDAIAMTESGFPAVSSCGASVTEAHLSAAFRIADTLVIGMDPDKAGRAGAKRAVITSLPLIRDSKAVKIATWPDAVDVDETLLKDGGKEAIESAVSGAIYATDFLMAEFLPRGDASALEEKAKAGAELGKLVREMPQSPLRDVMDARVRQLMGRPAFQAARPSGGAQAPRAVIRTPTQILMAGLLANASARCSQWFDPESLHEAARPAALFLQGRYEDAAFLLQEADPGVRVALEPLINLAPSDIEVEQVEAAYWRVALLHFGEMASFGADDSIWSKIASAQERLDILEGQGW